MLAELRSRSQITIPAEIIKNLGISEGDKFEVMEKDGGIFLCPVVIYPKEKLMALAQLLKKADIDTENQKNLQALRTCSQIWDLILMYNLKYTKEFEKGLKKLSKAEQKASMHGREAPSMTGFQRFDAELPRK